MKKSDLRSLFWTLLKRLKNRWNLAVTVAWSFLMWWVSVANNNVGALLFMALLTLLAIGSLYYLAKGK